MSWNVFRISASSQIHTRGAGHARTSNVTHAQMLHASFSSVALALFPSQTGGPYEAAQSV